MPAQAHDAKRLGKIPTGVIPNGGIKYEMGT